METKARRQTARERPHGMREVAGSNPAKSIKLLEKKFYQETGKQEVVGSILTQGLFISGLLSTYVILN